MGFSFARDDPLSWIQSALGFFFNIIFTHSLKWLHLLTFSLFLSAECLPGDPAVTLCRHQGPDSLNDKTRENISQRGKCKSFKTCWVKMSLVGIHWALLSQNLMRCLKFGAVWQNRCFLKLMKLSFGYFVTLKSFTTNWRRCFSLRFSFDAAENSLRTMCPFTLKLVYYFLLWM